MIQQGKVPQTATRTATPGAIHSVVGHERQVIKLVDLERHEEYNRILVDRFYNDYRRVDDIDTYLNQQLAIIRKSKQLLARATCESMDGYDYSMCRDSKAYFRRDHEYAITDDYREILYQFCKFYNYIEDNNSKLEKKLLIGRHIVWQFADAVRDKYRMPL
jgi:hypothetical protein